MVHINCKLITCNLNKIFECSVTDDRMHFTAFGDELHSVDFFQVNF